VSELAAAAGGVAAGVGVGGGGPVDRVKGP
jgi:hypothetical protein